MVPPEQRELGQQQTGLLGGEGPALGTIQDLYWGRNANMTTALHSASTIATTRPQVRPASRPAPAPAAAAAAAHPPHLRGIGERLYLSQHTVKKHATSVYRKLGVSSRSQAVQRLQELGLGG